MSTLFSSRLFGILKRVAAWVGQMLWGLARRGYALVLILIVLWLSWRALFYLVSSLMLPARPTTQIVDIPTKLSESAVMRPVGAANSQSRLANQRSPLAHYHRLDRGFQMDRFNGCTASQCHAPMPHGKNKADRAFLNMHATSIHCSVCHVQTEQQPLPLVWYDLTTGGGRSQAPALLRAYAWLTAPATATSTSFTVQDQTQIVRLLRAAGDEASGEIELISLSEHLAAVRASSDEFVRLVKVAREAVRGHFRGEYGAKLALADRRTSKPFLRNPGNENAVRDFLAQRETLTDEQKQSLLKKIHPQRRQPTLHCAQCHRAEGSLVDFPALGYPPVRVQAICSRQVTLAIDHIVEGRPFHLPDFLGNRE